MMIVDIILTLLFAVAPAIILHECAHGLVAYWMGDDTAKNQGRLTLNPIKHIDPVGSIIIPGALFLLQSSFLFGWAKPVPVNFRNIKNVRLGLILVAIAGPVTNVILAYGYIWIYRLKVLPQMSHVWEWAILFNIALCVFNLLPIPPLDGSRIVSGVLPRAWMVQYNRLEPFGFVILIILSYLGMLKFLHPVMALLGNWLGIRL
jgi:Zn-dependent protease